MGENKGRLYGDRGEGSLNKSPFLKNLKVDIEKIVYGGYGLARTEYGVILVPYTAPDDSLYVSSLHKRKGVLYGELKEVIQPSPHRVPPFCENFVKGCGGCQWQHIDYLEQIEIKRRIIEESLERMGKKVINLPPLISDPNFKGTRIRGVFHIDHKRSELGFYRFNSHELVPLRECPMSISSINQALSILQPHLGLLKFTDSVTIMANDKDVHLDFKPPRAAKKAYLAEIYRLFTQARINVGLSASSVDFGLKEIEFSLGSFKYLANAKTFFQGHHTLNGKLIEIIRELTGEKRGNLLLDLFCGVGFLSMPVASNFQRVMGIDSDKEAIRLAQANAKLNKAYHMEFYQQDLLENWTLEVNSVDVVILDPPRRGCPKRLREEVIKLNPAQIILVSCNPTTLARDLKRFMDNGYEISSCQAMDLFPQTFHVETITNLIKK